jgi:nucleoside-specific outer membrane channel protein Tsx
MVFFRNVQVRWMPIKGDSNLTLALERPGASADQGIYANRIELQGMTARFPVPDFTGAYAYGKKWGYVRVAGALRRIYWDDNQADQYDLSGSATGWGLNFSSNLKPSKKDVIRLQLVYGKGIENYMNDAPVDIGIVNNFSNPVKPILGKPIPIMGTVVFLDHTWNDKFSSTVGYSRTDIDNTEGQAPNAYRTGQYMLGNLLYTPVPNVMMGGEFQWGQRANFSDGFKSNGYKIQFSFKYNFSYKLGG